MKAKFVGDPSNPGEAVPEVVDVLGVTFHRDKFSDIPKELEGKFAGNSHFKVQGAKEPAANEETGESAREFAAHVNTLTDRDGLTEMLEAEKRPAAKAVLQARLDALPVAPVE